MQWHGTPTYLLYGGSLSFQQWFQIWVYLRIHEGLRPRQYDIYTHFRKANAKFLGSVEEGCRLFGSLIRQFFWNITDFGLINLNRRFGRTILTPSGSKNRPFKNQQETANRLLNRLLEKAVEKSLDLPPILSIHYWAPNLRHLLETRNIPQSSGTAHGRSKIP